MQPSDWLTGLLAVISLTTEAMSMVAMLLSLSAYFIVNQPKPEIRLINQHLFKFLLHPELYT